MAGKDGDPALLSHIFVIFPGAILLASNLIPYFMQSKYSRSMRQKSMFSSSSFDSDPEFCHSFWPTAAASGG